MRRKSAIHKYTMGGISSLSKKINLFNSEEDSYDSDLLNNCNNGNDKSKDYLYESNASERSFFSKISFFGVAYSLVKQITDYSFSAFASCFVTYNIT